MSELPKGWAWARLEELAVTPGGITDGPFGSNLKTAHYTETGPRVVRLQNIGDGEFIDERAHISEEHFARLTKHHVEAGDVLIASLGEELPRACVAPSSLGPALVKADCIRVRPVAGIASAYLMALLNSPQVRAAVSAGIRGVGRPRVNLSDLRGLELPVAPSAEQRRIVAELERRRAHLEAADESLLRAHKYSVGARRSVLSRLFDGTLLGARPELEPVTLGDLLQRIEAGTSFATSGRPALGGESAVVKVSAMSWGEFDQRENKALPPGTEPNPATEIQVGDLLISRANTTQLVGAVVIVNECRPNLYLSDKSLRLIPKAGVDRRWLRLVLTAPQARRQIESLASGTKESMRNISQAKLRSLQLLLPDADGRTALVEEAERRLSILDAGNRSIAVGQRRMQALRAALLAEASAGRLVPQNPDEEPAALLLERLRAERVAAAPAPRRRSKTKENVA